MAPSTAATFCATLVDEWVRAGCSTAVVAPGSRSTPLALALAADARMAVQVFHDERAAAYAALGVAMATGHPAPLVCTSGTAATHFHAAVVEASLSDVPMLVCTADRPSELWHVGAPQTIEQTRLYGSAVRFFAEPGVPDEAARRSWRSLAARAVAESLGASGRPGPVHLNLSFRDPLGGQPGDLPPGRERGEPWHRWSRGAVEPDPAAVDVVARLVSGRRGVIVAGAGTGGPCGVSALAERLGWPVLADPRSGCRALPQAVRHADALLRSEPLARLLRPDVVLQLGQPHASKVLGGWLAGSGAVQVGVERHGRWRDPERSLDHLIAADPGAFAQAVAPRVQGPVGGELAGWLAADAAAAGAIEGILGDRGLSEPATVRAALTATPPGGALVVASSMPVRDLEWFGDRGAGVTVHANRGANGIDGVVSTAVGVALTGRPTVCVVGDVAFLHDSTALVALARRAVALAVVVIDNDGGGIFSFLPQAAEVPGDRFELLFGTPHGTDLAALAAAHGLAVVDTSSPGPVATGGDPVAEGIGAILAGARPGVVVVRTDRGANVALHRELERAVLAALA